MRISEVGFLLISRLEYFGYHGKTRFRLAAISFTVGEVWGRRSRPHTSPTVKFARTLSNFVAGDTGIGDTTSAYKTIIAQWGGKARVMKFRGRPLKTSIAVLMM